MSLVPAFNQYVLPQTPANIDGVSGIIDIRISRGLYPWNWIDTNPTEVLTLDPSSRLVNSFSPRKSADANQDGQLTADSRTLALTDLLEYVGVSNGVTFTEKGLRGAQKSLLWLVLESDIDASGAHTLPVFQVWFTFMPTPTRGQYDPSTIYTVGQTIAYRGKTYRCTATTSGNRPVNISTGVINSTWWTPSYNIYFGGDIDMTNLAKIPISVHKPGTAGNLEWNKYSLTISPMINRAKNGKVGMLTDSGNYPKLFASITNVPFTQSDMVQFPASAPGANPSGTCGFNTTTRPFYLGISSRDVADGGNGQFCQSDGTAINTNDWYAVSLAGSMLNFAGEDAWNNSLFDTTWPHFLWGVKPETILAKANNCLGFGFTASTDFTSAYTFYGQKWNDTNKSEDLHTVPLTNLALCYNWLFGVNPTNSGNNFVPNSLAITPDTTLADLYKMFAIGFGCKITNTINQTTGQTNMQLLSRRTPAGTIPANFKMKKGYPKREQSIIAKDYIAIKNRGADGELRCPAVNKANAQGITIEQPFRVRPIGAIGRLADATHKTFSEKYQTINAKFQSNGQSPVARIIDNNNTPPLRSDGWMLGAYLYEIKTSTLIADSPYPPQYAHRSHFNSNPTPDDWSGFVVIAAMNENPHLDLSIGDSFTPGTLAATRVDAYMAAAQLMARELLDNKVVYTVEFKGCSDGAGNLSVVVPGSEYSWAPPGSGGVLQVFRAIEVELDELKDSAKVKFIPKPIIGGSAYGYTADLSTLFIDPSTNTSSGSGSSSNSTSPTTAPAPHSVIDNPTGGGQNNITVGSISTINLTRTRLAGQTADFDQWRDESLTVLASVSKDGNVSFKAGSFNGAVNMNSHLINNITDPASAQDAATKHYVDNALATVGSVTSVGLSLPGEFSVSGSPVNSSGTLTGTWNPQTANKVFASPNGATGTPTFRALVAGDIASGTFILNASGTTQTIQPTSGSAVPLVLKGNASQSTNLFAIQDSSANDLIHVNQLGSLILNTSFYINSTSGNFGSFTNAGVAKFAFGVGGTLTISNAAAGSKNLSGSNGAAETWWIKQDGSASFSGNLFAGSLTSTGNILGSGNLSLASIAFTGSVTQSTTDHTATGDATSSAVTYTLLAASSWSGMEILIIAKSSAHNTIVKNSGGTTLKTMTLAGQFVRYFSDGTTITQVS